VKLVGPAVTVRTVPGDWAKTVEAIDLASPGDVIVVDAGGRGPAVWGELATLSAIQKKLSGCVVDGAVRDAAEIRKTRFPVFSTLILSNAGEPKGLGEINVPITIAAYKAIADKIPYPLHIGITEAGTPRAGVIRSSIGIGTLLYLGIGDTIRVSLTAHPREEVIAGWEILKSLDLRQHGPVLVSCPTCGRAEVDIVKLAQQVETELAKVKKPIRVAVMGCAVNGPGEAKDADIGVACGKGRAILFKKGKQVGVIAEKDILRVLMEEVERL
jgi:1-hydroxy-2-methyl-2-(E)-butenyl 4-diphosphate synthase